MRERNIEQHDAETSRQGASIETRNEEHLRNPRLFLVI